MFLLVTLGVGAAAVNTGNNLLYLVLGMLLSLIVLSGLLSEVALRRLRVERRLPRRAFAGSPCLIELVLTNRKHRLASYSVELTDVASEATADHEGSVAPSREGPADGGRAPRGRLRGALRRVLSGARGATTASRSPAVLRGCYFLKVEPGATRVGAYRCTPSRRGRLRLTAVVVQTRFPFGLFEKSRTLDLEDELLVYPALLPDVGRTLAADRTGPELSLPRPGRGTEIAGLRDYRDGDEARGIHWRRTASLGRVVVRERQRDAARRITLRVDERRPEEADPSWDERFERSLSHAATVAVRALEDGAGVEAVAQSSRSPLVLPGHAPDPIWRFLAQLEPTSTTEREGTPDKTVKP